MIHHRQSHAQAIINQAMQATSIYKINAEELAQALAQSPTTLTPSQLENWRITLTAITLQKATLRQDKHQADLLKTELLTQLTERQNNEPLNLRGACFERMHFNSESSLNFMGADLSGASFDHAVFNHCSFEEANIKGSSLYAAIFSNCNLNDADLRGADLSGACFSRCTVDRTNFVDVILKNKQDGSLCNFEEVDMTTAQLITPHACDDMGTMKKSLDAWYKQVTVKHPHPDFESVKEQLSCALANNIHASVRPDMAQKVIHHTLFKPKSLLKHSMNKVASWFKAEEKLPYPTSSQVILKK